MPQKMSSRSGSSTGKDLFHRGRALSTPEILRSQQQVLHQSSKDKRAFLSPKVTKKNSDGVLELSHNRRSSDIKNGKNWPKLGLNNSTFQVSKSMPNFQDTLKPPKTLTGGSVSVEDQENGYVGNCFQIPDILTVKSLRKKQLLRKSKSSHDLGTFQEVRCAEVSGMNLMASRSGLLKPIPNAPMVNMTPYGEERMGRQSPLFSPPQIFITSSAGSQEPVMQTMTHGFSHMEILKRQKVLLDPIVSSSKQDQRKAQTDANISKMETRKQYVSNNASTEDSDVFHAKPRADALLNFCYPYENSSNPYILTSMPKKAPIDPVCKSQDAPITTSKLQGHHAEAVPAEGKNISFNLCDLLVGNANCTADAQEHHISASTHKEKIQEISPLKQNMFGQGDDLLAGPDDPSQFVYAQTKEFGTIQNKPFITLVDLEASSNMFTHQTTKPLENKSKYQGNLILNASVELKVNYKPMSSGLVVSDQETIVSIPARRLPGYQQGFLKDTRFADNVPVKGALPEKIHENKGPLGKSPSKRLSASSAEVQFEPGVRNLGCRFFPKQRAKKGFTMGSKPSVNKTKKNKPVTYKKSEAKLEKITGGQKSEVNRSNKIKKGLEYQAKTERMMLQIKERLNSAPAKSKQVSVSTESYAIKTSSRRMEAHTPVIHDAYPKREEDDEKLLQKVKVTVPQNLHPRRVKSCVPRRSSPQVTNKKSKRMTSAECDGNAHPHYTRKKKIIRAKSAALVVEKRELERIRHVQRLVTKSVATKEPFHELETTEHTIFSGKDWYVLALKSNIVKKHGLGCLLANGDSSSDKLSQQTDISYANKTGGILTSPKNLSKSDEGWSLQAIESGGKNKFSNHLYLNDEAETKIQIPSSLIDGLLTNTKDCNKECNSAPELKSKGFINSFKSVSTNCNSLTELDIEVIELPANNISKASEHKDQNMFAYTQKSSQDINVRVTALAPDDCLAVRERDGDVNEKTYSQSPDKKDKRLSQKQVQVSWTVEDNDSKGDQAEDDDEMTDEHTWDLQDNLQKLMRSMRQRSELDAHTLANYRKRKNADSGQESVVSSNMGDATSTDNTFVKAKKDRDGETFLEGGVLPMLFSEAVTLETEALYSNGDPGTFCPNDEVYDSESSDSTILALNILPSNHFDEQHAEANIGPGFEKVDDFSDYLHGDSDEDIFEELRRTLRAASLSEDFSESTSQHPKDDFEDASDACENISFIGPKLTEEVLQQHNQQQGASLLLQRHSVACYEPLDRESTASRNSNLSKTTDWSQNTETTITSELNTAACLGWKQGRELGHGTYGTVYEGLTRDGQLIAVKLIELTVTNRETAEKEFELVQAEVDLLKTLRHENVVRLLGTSLVGSTVQIFMEHIAGGSIASLLAQYGPLKERIFRNYSKQVLIGVEYLHSVSVVHRDIKGSNVMLMTSGIIKLIDFGCAKRLKNSLKRESEASENGQLLQSMRGTPYWMAPEVITSQGHGEKSDIWSIGCTVYEMATTKPPLRELEPAAAIFHIGDGNEMPRLSRSGISKHAVDFVSQCFVREPQSRPTASVLLQHKFILHRKKKLPNNCDGS